MKYRKILKSNLTILKLTYIYTAVAQEEKQML